MTDCKATQWFIPYLLSKLTFGCYFCLQQTCSHWWLDQVCLKCCNQLSGLPRFINSSPLSHSYWWFKPTILYHDNLWTLGPISQNITNVLIWLYFCTNNFLLNKITQKLIVCSANSYFICKACSLGKKGFSYCYISTFLLYALTHHICNPKLINFELSFDNFQFKLCIIYLQNLTKTLTDIIVFSHGTVLHSNMNL